MSARSQNVEKSSSSSRRSISPSQPVNDMDLAPPQLPQFGISSEIGLSFNRMRESRQMQETSQAQSIRREQQLHRRSQNTTAGPSIPQITVETDATLVITEGQDALQLPSSPLASIERIHKDGQSTSKAPADSSVEDPFTTTVKRRRWAMDYDNQLFPVESALRPPISQAAATRSPSSTRLTARQPVPQTPPPPPDNAESQTIITNEREELNIPHDVGSLSLEDDSSTNDVTRPTCSLMLVCYRAGPRACQSKQIEVISRSRVDTVSTYKLQVEMEPGLLRTDRQFFYALRRVYLKEMCSVWRRLFFLKTLRSIRLLSYAPGARPKPVPLDDVALQEIFYAYSNPSKIEDNEYNTPWIEWVYKLRKPDHRHALEFVDNWDGTRIAIAGILPWLFSMIVGVVWSAKGGDVQTAFTVAGFILTSGTLIIALLAVINGIETSGQPVAENFMIRDVGKRIE